MSLAVARQPRADGDASSDGLSLGRIVGIDMLRGFAIIGVVLNHLWDDIRYHEVPPHSYYGVVATDVRVGDWTGVPGAMLEAIVRGGYLVPLFMMLSGLSLYMATARKGATLQALPFYRRRFRQLLVPYWFAVALTFGVIFAIAALQVLLHGQSFAYQYHHVTESRYDYIAPGRWTIIASVTFVPRAFRSEWLSAPPPLMWFVVPIAQYYLLFPLLLRVLQRVGPAMLAAGALATTIAAKLALIAFVGPLGDNPARYLAHAMVPFRLFEFALGMSIGYLLIHHRQRMSELTSSTLTIVGLVLAGLALEITGMSIDERPHLYSALGTPIMILGVALIVLPILTMRFRGLERSVPARLCIWAGPLSFAILIANEPLRLFASFLRVEQIPTGAWWLYLGAYFPLTFLFAIPVARLLGLGRREPSSGRRPAIAQARR